MVHVLLVDDNDTYRKAASTLLQSIGHTVTEAVDLRSALIEARYLTAKDKVLTDKNLGDHRGIEPFLNYLKEEKPEVKVILASGEVGTYAKRELYCHAFFEKGKDDVEDLIRMIESG